MPTTRPNLTLLSITGLSDLTGKAPDTVRKRLEGHLEPAKRDGKTIWFAAREALPLIYEVGEGSLEAARTRLANEQADEKAMANAVARGELIPAIEVEEARVFTLSAIARRLDSLPSKAAPAVRATGSDAEGEAVLRGFTDEARVGMADLGAELEIIAPASARGGAGDAAASAGPNGRAVGRRRKAA